MLIVAGLSEVFRDLSRQLAAAALSEYGPNRYLFAGTLGFIVQADLPYMRGKDMGHADKLEAIARALSLIEYADILGDGGAGVLGIVSGVLDRHTLCIANNVEALNTLMGPEDFNVIRRAALTLVLGIARDELKNRPIVLFDMPPAEA